jgi:hypothetical protein
MCRTEVPDSNGGVRDGKPDGAGKLTRLNRSSYEGNFANGVMQGAGRLTVDGGAVYEGVFSDGVARGQGRISYPNGGAYSGLVEFAIPAGKGSKTMPNGRFDGEFYGGYEHGNGIFTPGEGKEALKDSWVVGGYQWPLANGVRFTGPVNGAGQRDGKGKCRSVDTEPDTPCEFKNDKRLAEPAPIY